jgi:hypothetical protein
MVRVCDEALPPMPEPPKEYTFAERWVSVLLHYKCLDPENYESAPANEKAMWAKELAKMLTVDNRLFAFLNHRIKIGRLELEEWPQYKIVGRGHTAEVRQRTKGYWDLAQKNGAVRQILNLYELAVSLGYLGDPQKKEAKLEDVTLRSTNLASYIYNKNGLPSGAKRYAILDGLARNRAASWIAEGSEEWREQEVPNSAPNYRNMLSATSGKLTESSLPSNYTIHLAHELPAFFGFDDSHEVAAAADVFEAARKLYHDDWPMPPKGDHEIAVAAMHLQVQWLKLNDMITKWPDLKGGGPAMTIDEGLVVARKTKLDAKIRGDNNGAKLRTAKETRIATAHDILKPFLAAKTRKKVEAIDELRRQWRLKPDIEPAELPQSTAESYIDDLRRSGRIPNWI